jgi:hypothetical protein
MSLVDQINEMLGRAMRDVDVSSLDGFALYLGEAPMTRFAREIYEDNWFLFVPGLQIFECSELGDAVILIRYDDTRPSC